MYKLYLLSLLSFIFFSANSYAYDEEHEIKKEVCNTEERSSCEYKKFSCTIKSTSKDKDDFEVELRKNFPLNSPVRKCECTEDSPSFSKTSFSCNCQGNIPVSMTSYDFEWKLFGSREMTCNHFINKLYANDYHYINEYMIVGPTF
jgi:hypothetical protein